MMLKRPILVLLFPITCWADLGVEIVDPGIGLFGDLNTTEVVEIEDGYRVNHHYEPGGIFAPSFRMKWSGSVWSVFTLASESTGAGWQSFEPFGNQGGFVNGPLQPLVLPPKDWNRDGEYEEYGYGFSPHDGAACLPDCAVEDLFIEFTLVEIDPPLPGDFDINNKVEFADFLTLQRNFGETQFNTDYVFLSWNDGDANIDGVIDFADFLILSSNFGAVRSESPAAIVPEPSSPWLAVLAMLILVRVVRQRRM